MEKLWIEWLTLYNFLNKARVVFGTNIELSAPFFSDDSGSHDAPHRLLYVGQATSGSWYDREFDQHTMANPSLQERIAERKGRNRDAIEGEFWGRGFWLTFRSMSEALENQPKEHANALWTNLAKIGVSHGNPEGLLRSIQSDLASRT